MEKHCLKKCKKSFHLSFSLVCLSHYLCSTFIRLLMKLISAQYQAVTSPNNIYKGLRSPSLKVAFDLFTYHMFFIYKNCQPILLQYMPDQVKMKASVNY